MNQKVSSLATDRSVVLPLSGKDFLPARVPKKRHDDRGHQDGHDDDHDDDAWRESMRTAIRSASELRRVLHLPAAMKAEPTTLAAGGDAGVNPTLTPVASVNVSREATRVLPLGEPESDYDFPVFVPREFIARMRLGDPHDPLLRQVLPVPQEGTVVEGFDTDPVGDLSANVAPGVLHKYHGRALMITTGACGVHCRYCFRRSFPYNDAGSRSEAYTPSIDYLRQRTDVEEVILSGGDPLTMTDSAIDRLLDRIEAISHVQRLRIHSRMPIVIPSRVNSFLVNRLRQSRLTAWMVVHCNHTAEIDQATAAALARMVDAGIPVLNQSVLLRGVNDDVETLEELSRALMRCRVIPYYLHQLDRVAGATHFEVAVERGRELIRQLETRLPGFAVPRYVSEIAGEKSKTRL